MWLMPRISSEFSQYALSVLAQMAGRVATLTANVTSAALIARALSPASFGEYVLVLGLITILAQIAEFGSSAIVGKELLHHRGSAGQFWGGFLLLRLALAVPAVVIAFGLVPFLPGETRIALLLGAAAVPFLAARFFDPVFQVFGRAWYSAVPLITCAAVTIGATLIVFLLRPTLELFILIVVGANVVYVLVAFGLSLRLIRPSRFFIGSQLGSTLHLAAPIGIAALLTTVNGRANLLILQHFNGLEAVAIYGAAARVLDMGVNLAVTVLSPLIPAFSRLAADADRLAAHSRQALLGLLSVALPVLIVAPYAARPIVTILYGQAYQNSALPLALLAWVGALACVGILGSFVMLARGITRFALWNTLAGVVVNLLLNFALVPKLAASGAAYAQIGSEVVMVGLTIIQVSRYVPGALPFREVAVPVLFAVLAGTTIDFGFNRVGPTLLILATLPMLASAFWAGAHHVRAAN